jgi:hypothetical protein
MCRVSKPHRRRHRPRHLPRDIDRNSGLPMMLYRGEAMKPTVFASTASPTA